MNVGELKKLIEDVPDDYEVMHFLNGVSKTEHRNASGCQVHHNYMHTGRRVFAVISTERL